MSLVTVVGKPIAGPTSISIVLVDSLRSVD